MGGLIRRICYFLYLRFAMASEAMVAMPIRRALLLAMLGEKREGLFIFPHVFIESWREFSFGHHVSINRNCLLSCQGGLTIGDNVAIGAYSCIFTTDHGFAISSTPIKYQPATLAPVTIGSNVWIGANVTILAGVTIADGTVIAAGSVVTRSVEAPDTLVAGVPAKFVKNRA